MFKSLGVPGSHCFNRTVQKGTSAKSAQTTAQEPKTQSGRPEQQRSDSRASHKPQARELGGW